MSQDYSSPLPITHVYKLSANYLSAREVVGAGVPNAMTAVCPARATMPEPEIYHTKCFSCTNK